MSEDCHNVRESTAVIMWWIRKDLKSLISTLSRGVFYLADYNVKSYTELMETYSSGWVRIHAETGVRIEYFESRLEAERALKGWNERITQKHFFEE
jgi:cytolysin (calcineurin-like family phosphatase)